ncbi:hypothetical protein BDFG_02159 [Blastomyces dermatitidis ATCC 26199]|nr:hypothetical protein BDFG_02159 [Blastomyces dermatitidis ATCC 26199]
MEDPCTLRPSCATVVHSPDEVFNIQSQERANVLSELRDAIQQDTVKASLWGCMQVCDILKLRELVATARNSPAFFSLLSDNCLSIPLRWMQRPPRDGLSSTHSTLSSAASNTRSRQSDRLEKPKILAKERDGYSCVLTKGSVHEVAHIFPPCMINRRPPTNLDASIPSFWKLLDFFFESDRLNRWRAEIFKDPSNPSKASDGCHNMICLSPTAHSLWTRGMFALRPISISDDHKELAVQFYWQPRPSHGCFDSVSILKSPESSRNFVQVGGNVLAIASNDTTAEIIKSGDTFIFRTTDPNTHPLPSFELLEMQWHLQRIVSMSGAAEIYNDQDDGDDDHLDAGIAHKSFSGILSWVPPPLSHSTSDDDEPNSSLPSVSTSPSPLKTPEYQGKYLSAERHSAELTVSHDVCSPRLH